MSTHQLSQTLLCLHILSSFPFSSDLGFLFQLLRIDLFTETLEELCAWGLAIDLLNTSNILIGGGIEAHVISGIHRIGHLDLVVVDL